MLKEKLKIEIIWFIFIPSKLSLRAKMLLLVKKLRRESSRRKQKEISQQSSIGEISIFHRTSIAEPRSGNYVTTIISLQTFNSEASTRQRSQYEWFSPASTVLTLSSSRVPFANYLDCRSGKLSGLHHIEQTGWQGENSIYQIRLKARHILL